MFCKHCGNQLMGNGQFCEVCGASVQEMHAKKIGMTAASVLAAVPTENASPNRSDDNYRSYEYARTTVKNDLAQVALDCYESLGYEFTGQTNTTPGVQTTLSFRRSRKVSGKAQLSKIQRTMNDTIVSIANMEAQKTKKATGQAIALGTAAALILGVGMCCTMVWTHLMALGIAVGVIGIAGCIYAFLCYRKTVEAESARLNPKIEAAYDRLATQCEEAQAVLSGNTHGNNR